VEGLADRCDDLLRHLLFGIVVKAAMPMTWPMVSGWPAATSM
jgi:hypothetical protein